MKWIIFAMDFLTAIHPNKDLVSQSASNILANNIQMLNDIYSNQKCVLKRYVLCDKINLIKIDWAHNVKNLL